MPVYHADGTSEGGVGIWRWMPVCHTAGHLNVDATTTSIYQYIGSGRFLQGTTAAWVSRKVLQKLVRWSQVSLPTGGIPNEPSHQRADVASPDYLVLRPS